MAGLTAGMLVLAGLIVLVGGLVKGTAGFGYAIASTAILAVIFSPKTAVVLMIVPTLAANVALLRELERDSFRRCLRRFWPFIVAAMLGTTVGMLTLERVPADVLTLGLGVFTLSYVALKQPWVALPGEGRVRGWCFRPTSFVQGGFGLVAGLIFGLSNVAVQVVAYLDSLGLDRSVFVGVLSMILVGIAGLRVALAGALGLYGAGNVFLVSVALAVPGLVGVAFGRRLRSSITEDRQRAIVLGLLVVVGLRLLWGGL